MNCHGVAATRDTCLGSGTLERWNGVTCLNAPFPFARREMPRAMSAVSVADAAHGLGHAHAHSSGRAHLLAHPRRGPPNLDSARSRARAHHTARLKGRTGKGLMPCRLRSRSDRSTGMGTNRDAPAPATVAPPRAAHSDALRRAIGGTASVTYKWCDRPLPANANSPPYSDHNACPRRPLA